MAHRAQATLSLIACLLLMACGGDSSSGNQAVDSSSLFYSADGLWEVLPNKPTAPVLIDAEARDIASFSDGAQVRGFLVTKDDGGLYWLGVRKGDSRVPVRVSTEQGFGDTNGCGKSLMVSSASDFTKTVILYRVDQPSGSTCVPGGWKLVQLGMGPNDAPIAIPASLHPILSLWALGGSDVGWLATEGATLLHCTPTFDACRPVTSGQNTVSQLPNSIYVFSTAPGCSISCPNPVAVLRIDSDVRTYDPVNGSLSPSRYTFPSESCSLAECTLYTDGTDAYVQDGPRLVVFPLQDDRVATAVTPEAGDISFVSLTPDRLVYRVLNPSSDVSAVRSFPRQASGEVLTLIPPTSEPLGRMRFAGASFVYEQGTSLFVVHEDGTDRRELPNTTYAGSIQNHLIIVDHCCSQNLVKAWAPPFTSAPQILGSLPAEITSIQFNGERLGLGTTGDFSNDVFYADPEHPQSLVRVTNTPDIFKFVF
jgi:hypothetical protein